MRSRARQTFLGLFARGLAPGFKKADYSVEACYLEVPLKESVVALGDSFVMLWVRPPARPHSARARHGAQSHRSALHARAPHRLALHRCQGCRRLTRLAVTSLDPAPSTSPRAVSRAI